MRFLAWAGPRFPMAGRSFLNERWLTYTGMTAIKRRAGLGGGDSSDDRKRLVEYWQSCVASGTPVDTEARMRRYDGAYRWFLFRANPCATRREASHGGLEPTWT
jgi:hypothetical protein